MPTATERSRYYYAFLVFYVAFQLILLHFLRSYNQDTHSNAIKILDIYHRLLFILNTNLEIDNSGTYKVITLRQSNYERDLDVTLVSQCSSNHFPMVYDLFMSWQGPISLAVFSDVENLERTLWDVAKLFHCFQSRDFALQLVVPIQTIDPRGSKFGYYMFIESDKSATCDSRFVSSGTGKRNYNWTNPYPVNLLRNTAKLGSSTGYILVIDVDMIPSPNLQSDFLNFMKAEKPDSNKVAYVVPVFETLSGFPVPLNKREVVKMVEEDKARPFYFEPCRNCQKLTNYFEWLSGESSVARVLYEVVWKHPWEPFFITHRDAPDFDERFKQYGMNRVSQICELYVAGYKFLVLDNVFLVHKGYKTMDNFHGTKESEMKTNRRLYARFKAEVKYKYPYSERNC